MIWKDTEWVTSVRWVICSSSTCLGLQLRTERHWARTCSEESRQGLRQVGPFRVWQDTSQQPHHHLPPHTPSGKAQQGGGERERDGYPHTRELCIEGDALTFFLTPPWGFKEGGLFPQPLPSNLSSEWGWGTTHRVHGCLQQVQLWHAPTCTSV